MGSGEGSEVQEGGDVCIHIADSLHCTAETNTTLYSNYTPIKKKTVKNMRRFTESLGILLWEGAMFELSDSSRNLTASTMKLCWGLDHH